MVHRPRYDDWSWAKGKLDPGEDVAGRRGARGGRGDRPARAPAAGRCRPRPTRSGRSAGWRPRRSATGWPRSSAAPGELEHEIDEVAWLSPEEAALRLDYARDQEQLRALVQADEADELTTWPLAVVRHAKAYPRGSWTGADPLRPLDARGQGAGRGVEPDPRGVRRAAAGLLAVHPLRRHPPAVRRAGPDHHARQGRAVGGGLRRGPEEGGLPRRPDAAAGHARRRVRSRPVLPSMLERSAAGPTRSSAERLHEAADLGLAKGEVLVAHMCGTGEQARVVAVERFAPGD